MTSVGGHEDEIGRNIRASRMLIASNLTTLGVTGALLLYPAGALAMAVSAAVFMVAGLLASLLVGAASGFVAGARRAGTDSAQSQRMLDGVALAAGIPPPRLYLVHDPGPNAFAWGRRPEKSNVATRSTGRSTRPIPRSNGGSSGCGNSRASDRRGSSRRSNRARPVGVGTPTRGAVAPFGGSTVRTGPNTSGTIRRERCRTNPPGGSRSMTSDLYEVLGAPADATAREITNSYGRLARRSGRGAEVDPTGTSNTLRPADATGPSPRPGTEAAPPPGSRPSHRRSRRRAPSHLRRQPPAGPYDA